MLGPEEMAPNSEQPIRASLTVTAENGIELIQRQAVARFLEKLDLEPVRRLKNALHPS
jgi:hypothetical protein